MKKKNKNKNKNGFTLIELITVVAIISILAAVSVPSLASITEMSKETACRNQIAVYQNTYNIICLENPTITKNTEDIVTFLLEQNVIDEEVPCDDGGFYYLENGIIYCSLHHSTDTDSRSGNGSSVSDSNSSGTSTGSSSGNSSISSDSSANSNSANSNNANSSSSSVSDGNNGNTGEKGNLTGVTSYSFKTKKYKDGFEYTLTIYNTGKVNITNWVAEITYPGTITSAWTADLTQIGGNRYRFDCCDYNSTIPYKGSVTITGNGTTWNGNKITGFSVKIK